MSDERKTLNLAGARDLADAAGHDVNGGRVTLDEGALTAEEVAKLAEYYRREIDGGGTAPTERLPQEQIEAAIRFAESKSGAAGVDGHRFDTSTGFDYKDDTVLPDGGYGNYLKVGVAFAVLVFCAYYRAEIEDMIDLQEAMDGLTNPEKLSPEKFQEMLDQQLARHPELGSLEEKKGLNQLLSKMRLDLCPDAQINSMKPEDIAMLEGYGFVGINKIQADCANGDAGKNLILVMSDSTSVEFRFEGEENAVKISSMVATGGARCTVDLGEGLLISCPAKDGMGDLRVYVGEEYCVQKMIVGDNAYTYTMSNGQCVKVDVSGWTETKETLAKAVMPSKNHKQKKTGRRCEG